MYDNIRDAWQVLMEDNVPGQVRSYARWPECLGLIEAQFTSDKLLLVDAAIGAMRATGDVDDTDSRIWELCAGEGGESEADEDTNEVLNWIFDEALLF